ncbi:hypothetical protein QBC34DRAFT_379809 [Podospora aff. communis PSN243]|uniref:Uncharacterized protein n=1 Tax=Podospora aff. communis PSN243 TaxID=3040156 RepID=A0AAV9GNE9_9PEZI|nr:hypothetical protein QBC34DRAFT_379809 [Podospora aff. communis PSN243]
MADLPPTCLHKSSSASRDASSHCCLDQNAASDLAAIRALLQAMTQHKLSKVPKDASSHATSRSFDGVDPKRSHYDEARTINYHMRQLPSGFILHHSVGPESIEGNPEHETILLHPGSTSEDLKPGVYSGVSWEFDPFQGNHHVESSEFGYDEDGYICSLARYMAASTADPPHMGNMGSSPRRRRIKEHIFKKRDGPILPPAWAGQRFGKEWNIGPWGSSDDKRITDDGWGGGLMAVTRSRKEDVLFQYHMRVFTTGLLKTCVGKVSGNLTDPSDVKRNLDIHEIRYAVGLKTTWELDLPVYTLITMTNSFTSLEDLGELSDSSIWTAANISPSIRATGVAAFAFRIQSLLPGWADQWSRLLDQIDRVISGDLANILSPESRREIMLDGNELRLLEFYPALQQILLIAADWIQESMDDLRWMADDMQRLYFSPNTPSDSYATFLPSGFDAKDQDAAIAVFKQNWDSVKTYQERLGKSLLARIARKQEEVKNLKEGMFNSTTVNEAKNSTKQNHYILIFTVVTIIYLPLSFISTLFALDVFDWQDSKQLNSFIVTITLVATGTYLLSAFMVRYSQRLSGGLQAWEKAYPV